MTKQKSTLENALEEAIEEIETEKRYYVAVAQRFNRLKTLKSLLKF